MDILKSKKFQVLIAGFIILLLQALIPELANLNTQELIALMVAYLVGQGIADTGKEKAKIEAQK